MKELKNWLVATLVFSAVFVAGSASAQTRKPDTRWAEIEKFIDDGLPQSAMVAIDEAYRKAVTAKNLGDLLRTIRYRTSCQQMSDEQPDISIINSLNSDMKAVDANARPFIRSLLGEAYCNYYKHNYWKIRGRSKLAEKPGSDIATWTTDEIIDEACICFMRSLQPAEQLQNVPVKELSDVLAGDATTRALRPTAYDLLAHRAVDILGDRMLMRATNGNFVINQNAYFADAKTFAAAGIKAPTDTLEVGYCVMKVYRDLTNFRLKQNDLNALCDLDLKRLGFVRQNGVYTNASQLYEQALTKICEACTGQKIWGKAALTLAGWYREDGPVDARTGKHRLLEAVELYTKITKQSQVKEYVDIAKRWLEGLHEVKISMSMLSEQIPNEPMLASVDYCNTDVAWLTVYRYPTKDVMDSLTRNGQKLPRKVEILSSLDKVSKQKIELPKTHDYQTHRVDIKVDSLDNGRYLIVVSDLPDISDKRLASLSYFRLNVTSLMVATRTYGSLRMEVIAADRTDGHPLAGVEVKVYDRKRDSLKYEQSVYTDADGRAIYNYDPSSNKWLVVTNGTDSIETGTGWLGKPFPPLTRQMILFSDRGIYRPGQTVYFKGILYDSIQTASQVVPNVKISVALLDANRQQVQQQDYVTNEFGSIDGIFIIPTGKLNGRMQVKATLGDKEWYLPIRVEEYKRPTFEVKMQRSKVAYSLGDTVRVQGEAMAYAGYPVDNAEVRWEVTRRVAFRPLRWYFNSYYHPYLPDTKVIASGQAATNDKGQFRFAFKAEAGDIRNKDFIYHYDVKVSVVDPAGETQSSSQLYSLSTIPFMLRADAIPANITVGVDSLKYKIGVTNIDGNATQAGIFVELFNLDNPNRLVRDRQLNAPDTFAMSEAEFTKAFPLDDYGFGQSDSIRKLCATWSLDTGRDSILDLSKFKNLPSGRYLMRFAVQNPKGNLIDSMLMTVSHIDSTIFNMNQWLTCTDSRLEVGDTATFWLAGGKDSSYIHCSILAKGKVVAEQRYIVGRVPQRIRIPVKEDCRGGFAVQWLMLQENRVYSTTQTIEVPYTNKMLDVSFQSFRHHLLPGEKEKWTLTIKGNDGKKAAAEMVATLYDASLDLFAPLRWPENLYPKYTYGFFGWSRGPGSNRRTPLMPVSRPWHLLSLSNQQYEDLNILSSIETVMSRTYKAGSVVAFGKVSDEHLQYSVSHSVSQSGEDNMIVGGLGLQAPSPDLTTIPVRTNFSETAFFFPALRTNEQGDIAVEFTMPDALTRWNMLGFAHTKDMKTGSVVRSLITQKKVAISAQLPRFFRQGDKMTLAAKVNNLTEKALPVNVLIRFFDAYTMQPVDAQILTDPATKTVNVESGQSAVVKWEVAIPNNLTAVTYRLTAQSGAYSDGEERSVPVLTNRVLVTESQPFIVRENSEINLRFDKLAKVNTMTTANSKSLTLEYSSNPAWYAVQALPVIMERPCESVEQLFSRFYGNRVATLIANSTPKIKKVFDGWRTIPDSKALISNLEKNEELKQALLDETPWVMQAANETERRKQIALLFDVNRMSNEQQTAWEQIKAAQLDNGGFPWFKGCPADRCLTQYIISGLEHLRKLNALPRNDEVNDVIDKALRYCDDRMAESYKNRGNKKGDIITPLEIQYLYICSFSQRRPYAYLEAFDFYMKQAEEYWAHRSLYGQAMSAIMLYRYGKTDVSQNILRSLKERAQTSDDMGMYWAKNQQGRFWYESNIMTQAMLIEAFSETDSDSNSVGEMRLWLMRNRQTNAWDNPKATIAAIFALLSDDYSLLDNDSSPLDIRLGGKTLKKLTKDQPAPEAGTGYTSITWTGRDIRPSMADLRVVNPNKSVAWGALYWQYFEDADRVTAASNGLSIKKEMYMHLPTDKSQGLVPLGYVSPGDLLTIRLEVTADRDFEYVHLRDARPAGFEPENPISGYRFKDGLGCYQNFKDASTDFFFNYLPKGTYVFEYTIRASQTGNFSNGMATIQCLYASEFNAHSDGGRIECKARK